MPAEATHEILSSPDVGDGNPGTVIALGRLAQESGVEIEGVYNLSGTSRLVRQFFHRSMTSSPEQAEDYTNNSEAKRAGLRAQVYAGMSFREFAYAIREDKIPDPIRWNSVQEHALLGARTGVLGKLGIEEVQLFVPDVYPKESAVLATMKHPQAYLTVWNRPAFEDLSNMDIPARLAKPYLLDAFRPETGTFEAEGVPVVAKSSGSGIPQAWENILLSSLARTGQDWVLHTPASRTANSQHQWATAAREPRLQSFCDDLGGNTRALIGYPSELVSVASELRERGVPIWMLTLPPRGLHEKLNLRFAIDHGLIRGELAMSGANHRPSFEDVEPIDPHQLPKVLACLEKPDWQTGVLGTSPIWRPASVIELH
jgi:hypothetical protein